MNFTNNRTVSLKKMMALAGLFWFFFLIFYLLGALTFHCGEQVFTAFYVWFNGSIFYPILATLLILTLTFHVVIATTRQLSNNVSSGDQYKKPYPKAVPRVVAWSGASIILIFIITHSVQMLSINTVDLYSEIQNIFQKRIYRKKFEERKKELYKESYALNNFIKQWFKLKRYLPYEESKNFFPSYAWPSHLREDK